MHLDDPERHPFGSAARTARSAGEAAGVGPRGTNEEVIMPVCPVCDAIVVLPEGVLAHELLDCRECATELEIQSLDPPLVREAPLEEEDWGE